MKHCEYCFPHATYIGELYPNHYLIFHNDHYKVVNDHDEIIRFPFGVPPKNPIPVGTSEEQIDVMLKTPEFVAMDDAYMDYVSQFRKNFVFHPQNGQQILNGCKMVGYDSQKDGWLEYWIVDRAARLINP